VALAVGSRIGHYQVTGLIGAGGMGEVYRAVDDRLGREVALKILPETVAHDRDRVARFRREAQALATVSHSGIAQIFGIEEASGASALVLELIEGPTLAEVLDARGVGGRLGMDDALAIARQIADALEAAHAEGIVHRDLKPANIKLRAARDLRDVSPATADVSQMTVKVLDFGLAKALDVHGDRRPDPDSSPTFTHQETAPGLILGTAAYMSPEQARGRVVDERADIWSFGVILYEMLSGVRLFAGDTVADVLSRVITAEPDWSALPADTPSNVRRLLRRCLEKEPKRRLRHIADARLELDDLDAFEALYAMPASGSRSRRALPWALAVAATAAFGTLAVRHAAEQPAPAPPVEFLLPTTGDLAGGRFPHLSPDGRQIAFTILRRGRAAIWVRPLDSLVARELPATDGADEIFWSEDSGSIGFIAAGDVKAINVATGVVKPLCTARDWKGASWSARHGVILGSMTSGLVRCETGAALTTLAAEDASHRFPVLLPGESWMLFLAVRKQGDSELRVARLDGTDVRVVTPAGSQGVYSAGHVLFFSRAWAGGRLMAMPFEPSSARAGEPFPITSTLVDLDVADRRAAFSASLGGVLAFFPLPRGESQLTWLDRAGKPIGTISEPEVHYNMNLNGDETRLAVSRATGSPSNIDIWTIDLARGNQTTRFTDNPGDEFDPVWSPDGSALVYNSNRDGSFYFLRRADPSSAEEVVLQTTRVAMTPDWSGAGNLLVYTQDSPDTRYDIHMVRLAGDRRPASVLATSAVEREPALSPDGRWMAYISDVSGREELWVRPFPSGGTPVQISTKGGASPRWRADGREICFVDADRNMNAVAIDTSRGLRAGAPVPLFSTAQMRTGQHGYAITRDGSRFLVLQRISLPAVAGHTVTTDWRAMARQGR
jgi:Tol biopolymer transport system component